MSKKRPVIDAWIQHPTPAFIMDPMFESLRRWLRIEKAPEEMPMEMTTRVLDAGEVDKAILTPWIGARGTIISNDEVAAMVARAPERLVGVAAVDLWRPMEAVRELRRCVRELGFRALRIMPWLWGLPPNDRRYYPVYAECVELGVPFCLQVGHAGPLMPSEPGRPIPYLDEVAVDFPELTIVAGHIGYPWADETISMARKYPNVYIDTSAHKPSRFPPALVELMKGRRGRQKVLFASDYPLIQPKACLDEVDTLGLDDEAEHLFLYGNAARIFGLD